VKSRTKNKYFSICTHLAYYTTCIYTSFSTTSHAHRDLCQKIKINVEFPCHDRRSMILGFPYTRNVLNQPLSSILKAINGCWLWSLIIFLIQRSLFSVVFIPHEDFTPWKNVHSSTWGSAEGGYPLCGVWGQAGVWGQSPRRKNFLVNVYCNFIVNLDRSL
jgi:hypothetical protein